MTGILGSRTDLRLKPGKILPRKRKYLPPMYEQIHTFDIEVTNYHHNDRRVGIVYLWTYAVNDHLYFYGRTMRSFKHFTDKICGWFPDARQVVYVHNLSYEFQFMRGYFDFDEVFCTDKRKVLYARYKNIEFRCSYLLTNKSLAKFLEESSTEVKKLKYDYRKRRMPWDPLKDSELEYCAHDTIGLLQALQEKMTLEGTNVITIPLTSTGYVRKDIKKYTKGRVNCDIQRLSKIDYDLYSVMKGAFIGGNCHANRFETGNILEDVYCYDITSSYPYCQMTEEFPVTEFHWIEPVHIAKYGFDKKFAYLLKVRFEGLELKDPCDPMPVISFHKAITGDEVEIDNGRILRANICQMCVSDIEFKTIKHHYAFKKVYLLDSYCSYYGQLPDPIKACIMQYFEGKCTLKGIDDYNYAKSKNLLNSIYGMSAFDIGKRRFKYDLNLHDYIKDGRPGSEILADYLDHNSPAEPYQWGVWTTAHARKNLDELICATGLRFVYCDTDSVYCRGKFDVSDLNAKIRKKSEPYKVSHNGKDYYLGVWEEDKYCKRFVTLGAKKYAYEDESGKVHTVTAGVNKSAGVERLEDFKVGHVFKNASKKVWYEDEEVKCKIERYYMTIPSSIYIEDSDYTLGLSNDYAALLAYVKGDHGLHAQPL